MQVTILCVGKCKEKYIRDAIAEYTKRLSRYMKIVITEVNDEKTPDKASQTEENMVKKTEADRLMRYIRDESYVIALDIHGEQLDSIEFADMFSKKMIAGVSHLVFLIGGSLGLHKELLERANEKVSFSKLTFPHQLMRVILLEQIYRAMRIINHEPYHK